MRFIFQHSPPHSPYTSCIGVAVHGSHWSKKFSMIDMRSFSKYTNLFTTKMQQAYDKNKLTPGETKFKTHFPVDIFSEEA